jgi:signal peptidase complex subunit 2
MGRSKNKNKNSSKQQHVAEAEAEVVDPQEVEDDDDAEEEEEEEEEEFELLQVETGDMIKVKQILDETVAATILDQLDEDYQLDNMKLYIMTAACVFAMFAQFAPLQFSDNNSRYIIGACCCCYFVLSGVLQLITVFFDLDCIMLTKPLPKTYFEDNEKKKEYEEKMKNKNKKGSSFKPNKNLQKYGVRVRSQFPRFSEYYTVILEFQGLENTPSVEQKWSVGQFFDKDGWFDEIGLQLEVEKLYNRLEEGKYDNKGTSDKKND